jgi:putative ATP-dependent endonuclease of the OLD family
MYISKVSIKNFRSIKETEFTLIKGKNVIIGKNNSGKSNILKAIDLVLGKRYLDKDKDLYCEQNRQSKTLEIILTIQKDGDNDFDKITQFKAYPVQNLPKTWNGYDVNLDTKVDWIGYNNNNSKTSKTEFKDVQEISIVFSYNLESGVEYYFFYKTTEGNFKVCVEQKNFNFIQKVFNFDIINSFREPKSFLKLTEYSWYGKLMKSIVDETFEKSIQTQLDEITTLSNKHFSAENVEINSFTKAGAFQDTNLTISVIPDISNGLYKHSRIDADDGYKSDFSEKGSGLQNAISINLYIYYIQKIATRLNESSLFCLEEPEIYLHPHGRRVINNRIEEYLKNDKTQAIITTHSTDFINFADNKINIIKVSKDKENGTDTSQIKEPDGQILKNKENLEMFFADKVVLCEGADKYILEKIAEEMGQEDENLGKNWLDNNNISIIKVQGKGYFQRYIKILKQLKTDWFIFGDLDNLTTQKGFIMDYLGEEIKPSLEEIKTFYSQQQIEDDKKLVKTLNDEKSIDRQSIVSKLENCIEKGEITEDFEKLWEYVRPRFVKKLQHFLSDMSIDLQNNLTDVLTELKTQNIFILSKGELENYDSNNIFGSHEEKKVIEKIENLSGKLSDLRFESGEFVEFLKLVNPTSSTRKPNS